jgi:hypothetical protein
MCCLIQRASHAANKFRSSSFWNIIRQIRRGCISRSLTVDGLTGEGDIANAFAGRYEKLYNQKYSNSNIIFNLNHEHSNITCTDIEHAIERLKKGKPDGVYSFFVI